MLVSGPERGFGVLITVLIESPIWLDMELAQQKVLSGKAVIGNCIKMHLGLNWKSSLFIITLEFISEHELARILKNHNSQSSPEIH